MGCRISLENTVQVLRVHSTLHFCRQHDYFKLQEHSQNHMLFALKAHKGKQSGMRWCRGTSRGKFNFFSYPYHIFNKAFLLNVQKGKHRDYNATEAYQIRKCRQLLGVEQIFLLLFGGRWDTNENEAVLLQSCISPHTAPCQARNTTASRQI